MEIELRERGNKGFAIAHVNNKRAGLMSYSVPAGDHIIINHTEVNEEYKGQGIGKKLLYKIVAMAREKDLKIIPLCPFANAMFKKLEDIKDVLKA